MRKAVLADSGPLYAAVDPSDKHHLQALQQLEELARKQCEVIVPFSTLTETYTLLLRKLGPSIALRWVDEISEAVLINPTPEDYRQAIVKLNRFTDQSITLFDATLAVLALRMGLRMWTYDHHFDVMRIPVWR
jgi:predicted nucleic acid-binding protein